MGIPKCTCKNHVGLLHFPRKIPEILGVVVHPQPKIYQKWHVHQKTITHTITQSLFPNLGTSGLAANSLNKGWCFSSAKMALPGIKPYLSKVSSISDGPGCQFEVEISLHFMGLNLGVAMWDGKCIRDNDDNTYYNYNVVQLAEMIRVIT